MRPALLALPLFFALAACDTGTEPDPPLREGFAPATRYLSLKDSTGAAVVGGWTYETRLPEPGDTTRGAFQFVRPEGLGERELVIVCTEVAGEPEALYPDRLTYRLAAPGGQLWSLLAACDTPNEGVWERIEDGDVVARGTFTSGVAVE
jgi:hypothetical protein